MRYRKNNMTRAQKILAKKNANEEKRLKNLEEFLKKENNAAYFDSGMEESSDAECSIEPAGFFEQIRKISIPDTELPVSQQAADLVCHYVSVILDKMNHFGDEDIATDLYMEWIGYLDESRANHNHIAAVICRKGGEMVGQYSARNLDRFAYGVFENSLGILKKLKNHNSGSEQMIREFIVQHGMDCMVKHASTTTDGLNRNKYQQYRNVSNTGFYRDFNSYACEAVTLYKESLTLLNNNGSDAKTARRFIVENYKNLLPLISNATASLIGFDDAGREIEAKFDTGNIGDYIIETLNVLDGIVSVSQLHADINIMVPEVVDDLLLKGDYVTSEKIYKAAANLLKKGEAAEKNQFADIWGTRFVSEMISKHAFNQAASLLRYMGQNIQDSTVLVVTDPEHETSFAPVAAYFKMNVIDKKDFGLDFMIAFNDQTTVLTNTNLNSHSEWREYDLSAGNSPIKLYKEVVGSITQKVVLERGLHVANMHGLNLYSCPLSKPLAG